MLTVVEMSEREANYQRKMRRDAAKKSIRPLLDCNNQFWCGWVQVLLPQTDGLPFGLEPN
jgi:hypothetical protein